MQEYLSATGRALKRCGAAALAVPAGLFEFVIQLEVEDHNRRYDARHGVRRDYEMCAPSFPNPFRTIRDAYEDLASEWGL